MGHNTGLVMSLLPVEQSPLITFHILALLTSIVAFSTLPVPHCGSGTLFIYSHQAVASLINISKNWERSQTYLLTHLLSSLDNEVLGVRDCILLPLYSQLFVEWIKEKK